MFSYAIIDVCPQFRWWCLVTQAACGLVTPSPSSGLSTRCGSGCSRSWTCTRSMPPAFPSKTLTWTAISSVAWATRTSSVLPAAWDTFSTTASQSSSGAVRLKVWEGIEGGGGGWLVSIKEKLADLSACGTDSRWSVVEKGSQSRSGVTLHGAVEGGEWLLKAKEMMDLLFALGRVGLLTKHRGDVAEKLAIFWIRVWGVVVKKTGVHRPEASHSEPLLLDERKPKEIHDAWSSCVTVCGRWHLTTKVVTGKPSTTGFTSIQYAKDNHTRAQHCYCSYLFLRKKNNSFLLLGIGVTLSGIK